MGIITKGLSMGRAYLKNQASKKATSKMKAGTSTRSERLEFGKRDKDIKSVPISETAKKDIQKSVDKAKDHFYLKNIDEVTKHKEAVHKGEKAQKKLKHMTETKRAYHIGKSIHPSDPAKGNK